VLGIGLRALGGENMLQPSHRIIGVIRIESPVTDISGGEEDDSTIGGVFARFAQRSLIGDGSSQPWWFQFKRGRPLSDAAPTEPQVPANLSRLAKELELEFQVLSDVVR
jgi:hypothetical protein